MVGFPGGYDFQSIVKGFMTWKFSLLLFFSLLQVEDNEDNEDDGEMQREQHGGWDDVWSLEDVIFQGSGFGENQT